MGIIKTTNIEPIADNGTVTLGSSGDTFTLGSGVVQSNLNYPAFEAEISGTITLTASTTETIPFSVENLDTNSAFDTGTYTFQPTVAGKYFVYAQARFSHGGDDLGYIQISLINESDSNIVTAIQEDRDQNNAESRMLNFSKIVDMNGSTNTLRVTSFAEQLGAGSITLRSNTIFGAYRIGS